MLGPCGFMDKLWNMDVCLPACKKMSQTLITLSRNSIISWNLFYEKCEVVYLVGSASDWIPWMLCHG